MLGVCIGALVVSLSGKNKWAAKALIVNAIIIMDNNLIAEYSKWTSG